MHPKELRLAAAARLPGLILIKQNMRRSVPASKSSSKRPMNRRLNAISDQGFGGTESSFSLTLLRARAGSPKAMAFTGSPFHHHLRALTAEYDKVMAENYELRKEVQKDLQKDRGAIWQLHQPRGAEAAFVGMEAFRVQEALSCLLLSACRILCCDMLPVLPHPCLPQLLTASWSL